MDKMNSRHSVTIATPYFPEHEQRWLQNELLEILNGRLSMGPRVDQFESQFAEFCGVSQGVAFPSCTSALEAALVSLGAGSDDEVLVPTETFIATGMSVYSVGAKPVITEISHEDFCMDFEDAWARVTPKTRGAIVVHFGGTISEEFPHFVNKMSNSGRFVIEDAAHAHGAELNGQKAGSFGDAACFSFYPTKIITTGEGGMLVTSNKQIAESSRSLQNRGLDIQAAEEQYVIPGRNNRFTEIAAAMGISQMRCIEGFLQTRREIASLYDQLLSRVDCLNPLKISKYGLPSYWRYIVTADSVFDRVQLSRMMKSDGISIDWPYDPPLHLQPVIRTLFGFEPGMLPNSESIMARHICLPMHAKMEPSDAEYVIDRLIHHFKNLAVSIG